MSNIYIYIYIDKHFPPSNPLSKLMTYLNPPFALNVKTNIGAKFIQLIDKHFPPSNPLSKLINRNTVKISYKCTPNLTKLISGHNSDIINESIHKPLVRKINCSKNAVFPS